MKYLYKNKYWSVNKEYNLDKILYLMVDRPNHNDCFIWSDDDDDNNLHRNYDLPSYIHIFLDGSYNLYWRRNGELYREKSKPVYIEYNGYKKYYS